MWAYPTAHMHTCNSNSNNCKYHYVLKAEAVVTT